MLGSRSFSYTTRKEKTVKEKERKIDPEKQSSAGPGARRGFGWRPAGDNSPNPGHTTPETHIQTPPVVSKIARPSSVAKAPKAPDATPRVSAEESERPRSKPLAVPGQGRSHNASDRSARRPMPNIRASKDRTGSKHDPNAMPPSVAALLAMTSIPRQASYSTSPKTSSIPRRYSSQQLMNEWKQGDALDDFSTGTSPNMRTLLTSPDRKDSLSRSSSEDTIEGLSLQRSLSIESLPSLTTDERSPASSSLGWSLRDMSRKSNRQRHFSLSTSVRSDLEHPLSDKEAEGDEDEDIDTFSDDVSSVSTRSHTPRASIERKQTSFKSNLTASLSALRSSWKTLSNFATTPYTLPEDHLVRGLFDESRVIQREMRPRPSDGPPSAELRRYLNPSAYNASPHSDFHYHGSHIEHTDYDQADSPLLLADALSEGSIIPLQERASVHETPLDSTDLPPNIDTQTEAGRAMALQDQSQQYRRELRENSEWLRICVLETNMRRAGKIEGPGHAKIWLPAREVTQNNHLSAHPHDPSSGSGVPRRWVAINA